jgi:hypothetical protein
MITDVSEPDPITARLEDQLQWYDRKSIANQKAFRLIKTVEIMAAAVIPFLGAFKYPQMVWATGALGVLITILEGLLHLNQHQQNWISYRATCEALKHEKYLYIAKAPPYDGPGDSRALLAERVESLVSQEHAKWAATQLQQAKEKEKS